MSIGLILLAAGNSSRMGSPKQLLSLTGKTLLRRAAEAAVESGCARVVVVLGHDGNRMKSEVEDLPLTIVTNSDWQTGMGSSIRVGIEHLEKLPEVDAALIMLCDQPRVDGRALWRLIAAYKENEERIAAAHYGRTVGVPAIFPRRWFSDLKKLPPSGGAQKLLVRNADEVIAISMEEAAMDVDTPEDFQRILFSV